MSDEPSQWRAPHRPDELDDPSNPPNVLLPPETRSRAVMGYVAPVVVLFVVVGIALIYWANRSPMAPAGPPERDAIGTGGIVSPDSPGGFDPAPDFERTGDELEYRGVEPGAVGGGEIVEVAMDLDAVSRTTAGRRVRLLDVEIDAVERNTLWLRDGSTRVAVVAPEGAAVEPGDRVDVMGTTEHDADGGVRVRASRVEGR